MADIILVSSKYQESTFLEFGVDPQTLIRFDLTADSRFERRIVNPPSDTFNIAYVGRIDVVKGIPVLLDAFFATARPDWRLTLMGQFCSFYIRRYVEQRVQDDPRINLLGYGDPRCLLESAHVFVHPTFEDGFGYAPFEALEMGVPVIVTDQTGMSEYVQEGINGSVVTAGDVDALASRLQEYYSRR